MGIVLRNADQNTDDYQATGEPVAHLFGDERYPVYRTRCYGRSKEGFAPAFRVFSPKSEYLLFRNRHRPMTLFCSSLNSRKGTSKIRGYEWFRENENGSVQQVR